MVFYNVYNSNSWFLCCFEHENPMGWICCCFWCMVDFYMEHDKA